MKRKERKKKKFLEKQVLPALFLFIKQLKYCIISEKEKMEWGN